MISNQVKVSKELIEDLGPKLPEFVIRIMGELQASDPDPNQPMDTKISFDCFTETVCFQRSPSLPSEVLI